MHQRKEDYRPILWGPNKKSSVAHSLNIQQRGGCHRNKTHALKHINNSVRSINATDHPPHSGNKWNPRRQNLHGMRQRIPRPGAQYNKGLTHRKRVCLCVVKFVALWKKFILSSVTAMYWGGLGSKGLCCIPYKKFWKSPKRPLFVTFWMRD
jgi:hypothetical protein